MPRKVTDKEKLKDLKDVIAVIDRPYFLVGGTALWAYRDNSFPPKSFGIGMWGTDSTYQEELNEKLEKLGFKIERHKGTTVEALKALSLLIFFLAKEDNEWWSIRAPIGRWLSIPDKFHKLEEIRFKRFKLKVPSPIEDYLLWCYGKNWRDKTQTKSSYPPVRASK